MEALGYASGRLPGPGAVAAAVAAAAGMAAIIAAHIFWSEINFLAHSVTVPVLTIPVSYLASQFGLRGAVAVAMVSALVLIDDPAEGRPWHSGLEIVQLAALAFYGGVLGALAECEEHETERCRIREIRRIRRLKYGPGYWDQVALTRMGLYVTRVESSFIAQSLAGRPKGLVLDVGAGSGRLEPAILPRSRRVIATEADAEVIRSMAGIGRVDPVLVGETGKVLPLLGGSLDWVICMELPSVSDEAWFRKECARVLKPGGCVIVTLHNRLSYKALWALAIRFLRRSNERHRQSAYYRHSLGWQRRRWADEGFELEAAIGLYWPPLSRQSDSRLVTLFVALERLLGLRRLVWLSPWVILRLRYAPPPGDHEISVNANGR